MTKRSATVLLLVVAGLLMCTESQRNAICTVYDPFKVSPDNAKFQIGGPFPLHTEDCILVRPETVQELVAIQWALTHWNQNPKNEECKLAMHAGDTCSRQKESVSQAVKFLQDSGFYEARECLPFSGGTSPTLLGMISPRDKKASEVTGKLVEPNPIPLVAYTTPSAEGLIGTGTHKAAITTAPTLHNYLQAAKHLLSHLQSNLISIVASDEYSAVDSLQETQESLRSSGIIVKDIVYLSDPQLGRILRDFESQIILCFLSKNELLELFSLRKAREIQKLWISLPIKGEKVTAINSRQLLPMPSNANLIILQEKVAEIPEFREYFLHILRNNYQSYSLLAAYMQQVYNCTLVGTRGFVDCQDLSEEYMTSMFEQACGIESAILATYSLAALGKTLATDSEAANACNTHGVKCAEKAREVFRGLNYEFDEYDPEEFFGFQLKFSEDSESEILVAEGLEIEGTQVVHESGTGLMLHKVLEYPTGSRPRILEANFHWSTGSPIQSRCSSFSPECQPCPSTITADPTTYSLSLPRNYDLYLVGIFDLHGGPGCLSSMNNQNRISLPMAFVHSLWTVKQRYPQLNLLPNVNLGGVVVDSCSSATQAVSTVLETSGNCMVLQYPGLNITLAPQNILGFVSGTQGATGKALRQLFQKNDRGVSRPLVSFNRDMGRNGVSYRDFSLMPTSESQAAALLQLLKNFDWSYVSVILSEYEPECVEALAAFRSLAKARGVCISEVIRLGDFFMDQTQGKPSSRVVVAFSSAEDTALYLRHLNSKEELIFVFVGDSHNWEATEIYRSQPRGGKWRSLAFGSISLQPKQMVRSEFVDWLESITPDRFPESWYHQFVEERFQCRMPTRKSPSGSGSKICDGSEFLGPDPFDRLTEAGYLARAVESLVFAVDATYKSLCPDAQGLCDAFLLDGQSEIEKILLKVPRADSFEIYNFRIADNQRAHYSRIGNWSLAQGLKFSEPWVWYNKKKEELTSIPKSECKEPLCKCQLEEDFFLEPLEEPSDPSGVAFFSIPAQNLDQRTRDRFSVEKMTVKSDVWKTHTWTYIFIAVNSLLLLVAVGVLTLISIKLYYRVVKGSFANYGNQSLGICLLFGIILLYISSYFFIFDPSEILCKCRYVFHSLAYSVCFGVLIAKATQLRNAETIGYNGYISYWNYWLLLFFIVGVQIALNLQWALVRTPAILHIVDGQDYVVRKCSWSREEFLLSQAYVVMLLLLTLFQAIMNRNIKRNYKETKWLLYTAVVCVPIWLTWMVAYGLIPTPFQDTVVVMELICCATVILCFMFGPKIYILLSYEPVLIEYPPGYKFNDEAEAGPNIDFLDNRHDPLQPPVPAAYRAVSPAGSSAASTQSTALSQRSETSSGEQSPVFQAVVRKKSRSKRIKANASVKRNSGDSGQNVAMISGPASPNPDPQPPPFTLTPVHRKNPLYTDPLEIKTN